ncbi:TetR/AcrR family transcriptional regulator [Mucilaginibacter sp. SG564]|uniref:TetR/AcrR family transcriptional regulator n=1 Tax=unclassified Mucilaginibacter TaxID=2617802 RepID=UPI001553DD94|nr:TetR/AcrR family transcriptional regulator [Mucilaginibacter sp. SG564]NOW95792.1 AcrR family transcriptional regulator [Mucilaginibacter sp. SG564]
METELSKAARTRQFIVEKTASIFNKKGYAGTSLSDLTEATGLTKGSIYGNFKNKEEVAVAAFEYNCSKVRTQIDLHIGKATNYHDKLMVYAQVYHRFATLSFPDGGCPILNTAVDADDTNPVLKEKAAQVITNWKKKLENLINGGITAGEFKSGIDVAQTALSIISLIEGGIMIAKVTNTPASLDKVLKTVDTIITQLKTSV